MRGRLEDLTPGALASGIAVDTTATVAAMLWSYNGKSRLRLRLIAGAIPAALVNVCMAVIASRRTRGRI
jgi:hypothetical protein